jgi:hypothetical protein
VVFAIGADDVFVACDKWKNVRLEHPKATTEEIASIALPYSAMAMFLTSVSPCLPFVRPFVNMQREIEREGI